VKKIDVVAWSADPAVFIANALSPAQVVRVILSESDKSATAVIPDRQQSLAIGKEGQNVRLAVKLTGWRIDIKSVSEYEAAHPVVVSEVPAVKAPEAVAPVIEKAPEKPVEKTPEKIAEKAPVKHIEKVEKPVVQAPPPPPVIEQAAPEPVFTAPVAAAPVEEEVGLKLSLNVPERVPVGAGSKSGVRFAEDILGRSSESRVEKKKKKGKDEEGGKGKKKRSGGAGEFDTDEYD